MTATLNYGYTITTFANGTRRAKPSGNQKIVITKAWKILNEDSTIRLMIVWDATGKVYRQWVKDVSGKIKRIK